MSLQIRLLPYAPAIIRLLQGVLHSDDKEAWALLISYESDVRRFFDGIGLDVVHSEADGYAFLRHQTLPEDSLPKIPRLIEKRHLSYPVTLLCVLLLERLYRHEAEGGDTGRLILTTDDIKVIMADYLPDKPNAAKLIDSIDTHINKLVTAGLIKRLSGSEEEFEVRQVLKAKIPAEALQEIKEKLKEHKIADA
ncbi:MAG: DUF4194 domain-containing protein [Thermodesulfovibrionales bacterium]|jgi:hypothetical protein